MRVSATDMSGTLPSAPVASNTPRQRMGSSSAEHLSGGIDTSVSPAQLRQMAEQMQSQLDSMNVGLQYSFYGEAQEKIAVKVVNKETGEVIREIPSREMQALQKKIGELIGMIFNDNA
jgi:flagellar protein FlaG